MAREIEVPKVDDGRRLDRFLERVDGGIPASLVRRLLRQRRVRVNGKRVRESGHALSAGDRLEIHYDFERGAGTTDSRRWDLSPLEILHRDESFLVVNKPAGVACSDDGSDPAALQVWLRERLAREIERGEARPEPCHRLDRGTTGIVVVALNPSSFDCFRRALEEGRVEKTYEVAVLGRPVATAFTCGQSLSRRGRARRDEPRIVAGESMPARTDFRLLASTDDHALLEARPRTGRTHQIRAHCSILGLPVVGDPRYGVADPAGHQLLHARRLRLDDAGGFEVTAEWPAADAARLRELGLTP